MFSRTLRGAILGAALLFAAQQALALPVFQVYVDGGTAGSTNGDEDTWFADTNSFRFTIVSNFGPKVQTLDNITLVVSVPDGQQGTIDSAPGTLIGRYDVKSDFLPDDVTFDNHYPFQDSVSDFILFDLGSLTRPDGRTTLHDYNAESGTITAVNNAVGQEDTYSLSFTDFDSVHLDVYGLAMEKGKKSSWEMSPNSHDSASVVVHANPLPPAAWGGLALLGGLGVFYYLRRHRAA